MGGYVALMLYIAIIWLVAYLIVTLLPVPAEGKTIIYVVAGIFSLLILLSAVGLTSGGSLRVPHLAD